MTGTRLAAVLLTTLLAGCATAQMQLADGGDTSYVIVVDPDATVAEKHAADELAGILGQVTGAVFHVQQDAEAPDGPAIIVGPGRAARSVAPDLPYDELGADGILIETRGDRLVLAGDPPRGTLYAVYTFLEDVVGCRWWSSTASTIPDRPDLTIPDQHVRYEPPLEYREVFWWDAFDADWAVRNKSNGHRAQLNEQRGGNVTYAGSFVHTFNRLIPPGQHFAEHPEWFSERNGHRIGAEGQRTQLCLSNPEVLNLTVHRVRRRLQEHPDADIVSVSQNDWDNHCLCARCREQEEADGSPAGPLLRFVNAVAERIADDHPGVAIDTLAYQYTRRPPTGVEPLPGVIVRLCSIECSFLHPLASETNATFGDDIRGWHDICDRLYVWDYTTNFGHYIQPHPNLRVLAPNIRFFVEHGVKGLFEQGAYQSPGAEFAELKAWMLAKLMWDPSRRTDELIDQFCAGYYEDAAPHIRQYIDLLHDDAEASDHYLRIGSGPTAPFLTLDLMARAEVLFDLAEAAVADRPEVLGRVRLSRLPIRYVWATRWQEFEAEAQRRGIDWPGPDDFVANAQTFMEVARANEVTKLSEGRMIEAFERRTIGLGRTPSPPPPGCEELPRERWIDLQDRGFRLSHEGSWATLEEDPRASDGVASRMPGDHYEWATQQDLAVAGLDPEARYTVYAGIRCDATGEDGKAFSFGVYDVANRRSVASGEVACADLPDDEYHTYEIGTAQLHDRMYIWVAPPKNPDNVEAVWVDRFWLVKEE